MDTPYLTPAQSKIATSKARFKVINCGRRFGKTHLAIWEMLGKAVSKDDRRVAYVAPTYQQARDIAWAELIKRAEPITKKVNESRLELTVHTQDGGESKIVLRGWESIETLRGQKFDTLILDEVAMMRHFWENWEEVLRPTLTDRRGNAWFISTPKGFNHFYEIYEKATSDDDYESFHFTTYDNPHIPVEEIEKAKEEIPTDRFHQEYMADFRQMTGLVYKEFQRARHVYSEADIDVAESIAGLDFGFTNPTALLNIKLDRDGVYWITDEWYKTGQTHEHIAEYVASLGFNKVYPDPASPEAIKILQDKGVNCMEVVKGKDSIISGIQKVRELFKQGRIKIHESCKNLIWELETYAYDDDKIGIHAEVPIKENDHAVDALRYALMSHVTPAKVNNYQAKFRVTERRRYQRNDAV